MEEEEDEELLLESDDSDFTAEKRSCMNFPIACRRSWVEVVDPVDELELSEVEFWGPPCGGPLGGVGMDIPIWLNACMMSCNSLSFPPRDDSAAETWLPEAASPLPADC